jgi:2-succinyl-5-enolpyruvyl-6-hydroxy-3-cyclohexene-1-carboxylate synthase
VALALAAPAGPVHLDLPFREPLVPDGGLGVAAETAAAHTVVVPGSLRLPAEALDDLAARLTAARRGLIVCGPLDAAGFAEAVTDLAARSGFPVIADALANVRFGPHDRSHVIARADALLRVPAFAEAHRPDLVVRFGGTPTSKALQAWLDAGDVPQVVVDDGGWNAPTLEPLTMVRADPVLLASDLAGRLAEATPHGAWLTAWRDVEEAAQVAGRRWLEGLREPFEGQLPAELATALPDGAILFVGSSMPIRDLEAFSGSGAAAIRCAGNRGANGIDGLVSTALGMAAVSAAPVVAVVGDLAFLHDLNALVAAARLGLSATIVLANNDGGGIFSFLPQADVDDASVGLPEHFEALFGTPHGMDLGAVARALGAEHRVVGSAQVAVAIRAPADRPGVRILEVRTDRARNVELHREVQAITTSAVIATLTALPAGSGPAAPRVAEASS